VPFSNAALKEITIQSLRHTIDILAKPFMIFE